jgi:uncharacterized protein YodC (DUF2158 family)
MATVGDVVYLKSGGPPMTAVKTEGDPGSQDVTCAWTNGRLFNSRFPENALTGTDPLPDLQVAREKKIQELREAQAQQFEANGN